MKADYYQILGVSRDCDEKSLKSAFRKLAMQYHPDRNPNNVEAERKFKEIGEAYEVLKDPQKRAAYDRYGHAGFENNGGFGGFSGAGAFSDIFEGFFGDMMGGSSRQRASGRERGADLSYNMKITLEEAYYGKKTNIKISTAIPCTLCEGRGIKKGSSPITCITCQGSGRVRNAQGFFTIERICPGCQGQGEIIKDQCHSCRGEGRVRKEKELAVNIPAGVEDGLRIRLSGEGEVGVRGAPSGDLYIFLSLKPHKFFQREGLDLYCTIPVSMVTAALGGQFEVTTLDSTKTRVKVPAGTQNGKQFRLSQKGMPRLQGSGFGDLYIQVKVETPQNLSKKQAAILSQFEEATSAENSPETTGFFKKMKDFFEEIYH